MRRNPIMETFRRFPSDADHWQTTFEMWRMFGGYSSWDDPKHTKHAFTTASYEEIILAERIIMRYFALNSEV
jgi:hypothetical protein